MTYLAVLLIGAALGAFCDRWWANYLADSDDRTIRQHQRARDAITYRRWE